jgi:hypothetical protein
VTRGLLEFLMLAFVVLVAVQQILVTDRGALGFWTGFTFRRLSLLPPEGLSAWTRAFGYPFARVFWGLVVASVIALPVLHGLALRARRRLGEPGPPPESASPKPHESGRGSE